MKSIITIAQDLHFQLYGKYFHDSQDSDAQIILCFLQEMGKLTLENVDNIDFNSMLHIPSDKLFLNEIDYEFYNLLNAGL